MYSPYKVLPHMRAYMQVPVKGYGYYPGLLGPPDMLKRPVANVIV